RRFDLHARLPNVGANGALFGNLPSECNARIHATAHGFERSLGHADQAHAVMDSPWTQPPLSDLETAALAQQNIRRGHPDILERNFCVTMRSMIVAENRQHALHLDTWRVHRH